MAAPADIDVHAIRQAQELTQEAFAKRYGFSAAVVRNWEQGRRRPNQAARILLMLIQNEPEAVRRVLGRSEKPQHP
ncbi:MAG: helix-turn-helix domain-containing protein [Caulobacteraceae bacterium]|nr:helix-turn-helix domain-containing protein [Caulobacteraceae bacterium]